MESSHPWNFPRAMHRVIAGCVVVLLLGGCSNGDDLSPSSGPSDNDAGAVAVWTVGSVSQVGPDATMFTAMVRRLGCNNGVTGDVRAPNVEVKANEVVVTFTVTTIKGDATCPDNDEVPYEVALPEPLGNRVLLDGQCVPGTDASETAFCRPDGTRYSPE